MQEASDAGLSDRIGSVVDFLPDPVRERAPQFPSLLSPGIVIRARTPVVPGIARRPKTLAGSGSANCAGVSAGGRIMTNDLSRGLLRQLQNEVMDGETQGIHRFRSNRGVG